jgi:hypothetical protein
MIIVTCIYGIAIILGIIGLIRSQKVYKFRTKLLDDIFKGNNIDQKIAIFDKVSYIKMALDLFTPLTLENYWSEKDIKILLSH